MTMDHALAVFENFKIRRIYDEKAETWYFSVVDIVAALLQQPDYQAARNYWKVLKHRLTKEGSESVTKCNRLKLSAADGKSYLTDVADPETLLRIIQSVPSPKAEPIKLWLAKVGYERIQDMSDPARSLDRAREYWQLHGRSEKWIQQRMTGQETRNKLTDYWKDHEIKGEEEYAILTNIIHQEWTGVSVKKHKTIKFTNFSITLFIVLFSFRPDSAFIPPPSSLSIDAHESTGPPPPFASFASFVFKQSVFSSAFGLWSMV